MNDYTGIFVVLTVLIVLLLIISVANLLSTCKMIAVYCKGNKRNRLEILREYNNIADVLRGINNFVLDYQSQKKLKNIESIIEYNSNDRNKFKDIDIPIAKFIPKE